MFTFHTDKFIFSQALDYIRQYEFNKHINRFKVTLLNVNE